LEQKDRGYATLVICHIIITDKDSMVSPLRQIDRKNAYRVIKLDAQSGVIRMAL
jgi:hypothetical protein